MATIRLVWLALIAGGLAAALPAQAADSCATVAAEVGGGDPVTLVKELDAQAPGNPRALWQAATTLRCAIDAVADQAPRCLRAGQAKMLYDKFLDEGATNKALKKEVADARKSADQIRQGHGESCAALALQTAKAKQHGTAAQLYEAVFSLTNRPLQLFNAARACELGALWTDAEVYYTAYLGLPIPWRDRRDAVAKLIEIQKKVASDAGSLVKQAQQMAVEAKAAAVKAEALAQSALLQAQSATAQAQASEKRAGQAEAKVAALQSALQQAQAQTQVAESRALTAHQAAVDAQQRVANLEATVRQLTTPTRIQRY